MKNLILKDNMEKEKEAKEVQKSSRELQKNKFEVAMVFAELKTGLRPSQISKKHNISISNLSYYLDKLKKQGIIRRIGYGTWEILKELQIPIKSTKDTLPQQLKKPKKETRGHAFIWKVKLPNIHKWSDRIDILKKHNIDFELVGITKRTPRIIIKGKKVWLANTHLTIYDSDSYFGTNAVESKKLAIDSLLTILRAIENRLQISLQINKNYYFNVRRSHYGLINNALAIQCDKTGKKIYVYNDKGLWFLIDNSLNLKEAETLNEDALPNSLGAQGFFNSQERTKWKVTPEFVLNTMNGIQQSQQGIQTNQLIFAENMKSHIAAIQELGKAVRRLTRTVNIKHNIQKLHKQSNLNDFR